MDSPETVLMRHFGFAKFREPQDRIVTAILQGRDTLVIMPTGGGKSLCYQLPALMLPHLTLVVSPLIALMKDQVDALRARGIAAASLNGMQTLSEQNEVFDAMRAGTLKLVYVAPERFRAERFRRMISEIDVSLFAVDEAHCLSQWGHDFRPDYLKLDAALALFRRRPTVAAFTATATPDVREDIRKTLRLRAPAEFVAGFARPNLSFNVRHVDPSLTRVRGNEERSSLHLAKLARILEIVKAHRTGIVYCATRRSAERVADDLAAAKVGVILYHGGMSDAERNFAQDRFMSGEENVAVATNAFGMGIDRADIRFVVHYEMPGSIEAYYQEAGRAGRDGAPGFCEMLFNYADKRVQDFFIEGANPDRLTVMRTYKTLRKLADEGNEIRISADALCEELMREYGEKVNPMAISTSIAILARHDVIGRFDIPGMRIRGTRLLQPDLSEKELRIPWENLDRKRRSDEKKLEALVNLAYGNTCRQEAILAYFGDAEGAVPCGRCDVCVARATGTRRRPDVEELVLVKKILSGVARLSRKIGQDEWKPIFGRGRVLDCLLGSRNAELLRLGHDRLSTYGILRGEKRDFVSALMDALTREGLLASETVGEFPLCRLTPLGSRVMRGAESFEMEWPVPAKSETKAAGTDGGKRPRGGAFAGVSVPRDPDAARARLSREERDFLESIGAPHEKKKKRPLPPWLKRKLFGKSGGGKASPK